MSKKESHLIQKFVFGLMLPLVFVPNTGLSVQQQDTNKPEDVFEMPLEQLMEIEVVSTATLTETKPRLIPAAVTTITAEQIRSSGARSLYELLDIYVPNLQWSRHHWENDQLGLRGIINDRSDKYLLLVNGRNLNDRTHFGALTEIDQVLLGDIHHIDVVRGPGSALYGPGAISMVINVITYNSDTFQGTEVTSRLGAIEEFYTGELKHGRKFDSNDGGIFVYSGFGKYVGASKYDAPQIYPFTFPTTGGGAPAGPGIIPGEGTKAGHPMTNTFLNRDGAQALETVPMKLHVQLKKGNWDIWARLTRGGKQYTWATGSIARDPYGWGDWAWWTKYGGRPPYYRPNFYTYLQFTGYVGYKQELTEHIDIDYVFSGQSHTIVEEREVRYGFNYREDNYYAKILLRWQPNDQHKIAIGTEYLHSDLGLLPWNGLGWKPPKFRGATPFKNPEVQIWGYNNLMPTWSTQMYSLLGEWQWNINDQWTTFIGGRLDRHTFTDTMFSPRAAIVHTPNQRDTYKVMFTRSVRTNFEEEMKRQDEINGALSSPEKLTSFEFRYERKCSDNLDLALSVYHHKLDAISWAGRSTNVGTQKDWGIEGELSYHTEKTRLTLSHGYTKLIDFEQVPGINTYITAKPYGYGDDLTNWSNHNTKLVYQRKLDDKWTFDASMRIYWGFPGLKDYDKYNPIAQTGKLPVVESGWQRAYRGSYFLDLGLNYKYSKNLEINVTGYNLLGIFNKDFNKRNYIETGGTGMDFRSHAAAVGVSLTYTF